MDEQWLDASDIAKKTDIPVETVRRYIRDHGVHLKSKKLGRYHYVHGESLDTIRLIRQLYSDGKKKDEIEEVLSARGIPMTITVDYDGERTTVNVADKLLDMEKTLLEQQKQQQQFNEQHQQFIIRLLQEFAQNRELMGTLQNRIESSSYERVNKVLEKVQETLSEQSENNKQMVNQVLETFQQTTATHEIQRREERFIDMVTRRKIESQLRQEALREWSKKPDDERMIRVGFFRKVEDINKRDLFIEEYKYERIDERIKQVFE